MIRRNTPKSFIPHSSLEYRVSGLRDTDIPPSTYTLKRLMTDGTIVYVGEFPTPEVKYGMRKRGK
jgi:hypothetical protein